MIKQKLTHWVDKEFKDKMLKGQLEFRELTEEQIKKGFSQEIRGSLKPVGFWLSVDRSWERWLKGNWEDWLKGKICLKAILSKDINLFIIDSKETFLEEFRELMGQDYMKLGVERWMMKDFHIKLKEKYDGVWLKAEPFWRHRLDLEFAYFYAWDCESICVWNKDKIKFKETKDEHR